jgi:hypothetical protein
VDDGKTKVSILVDKKHLHSDRRRQSNDELFSSILYITRALLRWTVSPGGGMQYRTIFGKGK